MEAKPQAAYGLQWYGVTDRGKVRSNNEDSFLCLQFDAQEVRYLGKIGDSTTDSGDFVFAVSDGMGGAMAGEFASRSAVEKITRLMPKAFKQSASGLDAGFGDILTELFAQIHKALMFLGQSYEECAGMGATLSLCWFTPGWMYFGHIGDSRIYYLSAREGTFRQISQDDTYVGWLRRNGKISEYEARAHPGRNSLQKALGAGHQFVDPQLGAVGCSPGDVFLLCSDGLIDGIYDSQLGEMLKDRATMGNPAQALVASAVSQSGRDNVTALVIEVV